MYFLQSVRRLHVEPFPPKTQSTIHTVGYQPNPLERHAKEKQKRKRSEKPQKIRTSTNDFCRVAFAQFVKTFTSVQVILPLLLDIEESLSETFIFHVFVHGIFNLDPRA